MNCKICENGIKLHKEHTFLETKEGKYVCVECALGIKISLELHFAKMSGPLAVVQ